MKVPTRAEVFLEFTKMIYELKPQDFPGALHEALSEHCKKRNALTPEPARDANNWAIMFGAQRIQAVHKGDEPATCWRFPDASYLIIANSGNWVSDKPLAHFKEGDEL